MTKKTKKVKKRIDKQKVFWAISIAFLFSCIVFYGGRLIYYYNKFKVKEEKSVSLYQEVINSNYNEESVINLNGDYYFTGNDVNNYVRYSNILFRIVRLNNDESITIITDRSISDLSMGEGKQYSESYVYEWLNKVNNNDDTGIFIRNMNNVDKYLANSETCLDSIDDANNKKCKKIDDSSYVTLLSLSDYINTGNVDSFINNGEYFYLSSNNSDNDIWYVNDKGKVGTCDGTDVYGIRPVITISKDIKLISGDGSKDNPYVIEKDNSYFGGYVKLDNDIWRIYQINNDEYKLMLNDYLTIDNEKVEEIYSNNTYKYNDTQSGSLAYYLNNTYLNSLSYKDIILNSNYSNGYYVKDDYRDSISDTIETKVGVVSVGDIILNNELDDYYTMTGNVNDGKMVYVVKNNGRMITKSIKSNSYVVPCITISKDSLVKGNGSLEEPYEME